ncbi:LysR family transcriptional regulator [Nocardioides sambongensis]|uniref:LysR family transcriptional regulator n=1 Tax=Nocardioides sambongensis TaxID=2589074 RepID=UPI0015E841DC|nr:LysR family transcriptional regulator [Nocardioides sambongensis]
MSGIRNIDVHLLATLDHLLRERSVTLAAHRLGVSQPAVSASLARLRRHFDDQLLLRRGGEYALTPLAQTLAERVPGALAELRALLDAEHAFDPATTTREFVLVCSDHVTTVYGSGLVARLREAAPGASVRFVAIGGTGPGGPALADVDGLVLPRASIPDLPSIDLARGAWVLVADPDHPVPAGEEGVAKISARPWVSFRGAGGGHVPPVEYLLSQGVALDLDLLVPDFGSIPFLVRGTPRIGILPRRHAQLLARAAGVAVFEPPVVLPELILTMVWDPSKTPDHGHAWFCELLGREELLAVGDA